MAIEFSCSQCRKTLRVPDEHLGKKAQCPNCQAICLIEPTQEAHSNIAQSPTKNDQSKTPTPTFSERPAAFSDNPFAASISENNTQYGKTRGAYLTPHRGALVLTLGIVSLLINCLLIPGILAWVFGSSDLKQMKAGMMDPEGYTLTQVGMILGIIGTLIPLAIILIYVLFIVVFIFIGLVAAASA